MWAEEISLLQNWYCWGMDTIRRGKRVGLSWMERWKGKSKNRSSTSNGKKGVPCPEKENGRSYGENVRCRMGGGGMKESPCLCTIIKWTKMDFYVIVPAQALNVPPTGINQTLLSAPGIIFLLSLHITSIVELFIEKISVVKGLVFFASSTGKGNECAQSVWKRMPKWRAEFLFRIIFGGKFVRRCLGTVEVLKSLGTSL